MSTDLQAAALRVLNADPGASMSKIAQGCGVSRATLNRRYAGREDLIVQLGREGLDHWAGAIDESRVEQRAVQAEGPKFLAALRTLVDSYVEQADSHGFTLTESFYEQVPDMAERAKALSARETAVMRAGQELGVLTTRVPAIWLGWSLFGSMVAVRDALRHQEIAVHGAADLVWDSFMNGAGA